MMSEHGFQTYEQGDVSGLDFNGTNDNAFLHPRMGQWIAHWMQSYKARPSKKCHKHGKTAYVGNQLTGHACLTPEQVKSEELKRLCLDIYRRHTSGCKDQSASTVKNVDLLSHALESDRTNEVDWGKLRTADKSTSRSNIESFDDEIACSDSWNITESFIKGKTATSPHFQNQNGLGLEPEHFSTFDVNGKVETMIASMEKSYANATLVKSPVTSSCFEWPDRTHDGSRTSFAINGCKCQETIRDACMFNCGLAYKVPANSGLSCMQDKLCCCSSSNKFISKGTRDNSYSMSTSSGNAWTIMKDGSTYVHRDSNPNHPPYHFSVEEYGKNVKDDSTNQLLLGHKRRTQTVCSNMQLSPSKVPKFSMSDASQHGHCQNLKSVENVEGFYKYCRRVNSVLVAENMGLDLCRIELMTGATSAVTQLKEIAFSETFMMPTKKYYGGKVTATLSFGNLTDDENRRCHGEIGTHLMEANNESSTKTDTLYCKPCHRSSSILGQTFSRPPRIIASTSQAQDSPCRSAETEASNRIEPPVSTQRATSPTNKDPADHILFQNNPHLVTDSAKATPLLLPPPPKYCRANKCCFVLPKTAVGGPPIELQMAQTEPKIADISSHSCLQSNASESETCSRWLKRLQCKSLPTNRFQLEKTISLSGSSDPSLETFNQPWVSSWHYNRRQMVANAAFLPVKGKRLFASIRAMALMGKAIKNYKPCKFRRKKAILIWTT